MADRLGAARARETRGAYTGTENSLTRRWRGVNSNSPFRNSRMAASSHALFEPQPAADRLLEGALELANHVMCTNFGAAVLPDSFRRFSAACRYIEPGRDWFVRVPARDAAPRSTIPLRPFLDRVRNSPTCHDRIKHFAGRRCIRRRRGHGRDRGAFKDAEGSSFQGPRRIFALPARNCELKYAVAAPPPLTSLGLNACSTALP